MLADLAGANHPETAPTKPPPPRAAEEQAPGTIALLARLEKQIAENRMATPPDDNAADTLQAILTLLPNASLADSQLVAAAFSHFADRARKAEAAGRHDEAKRFATFGDQSGRTTLNDGAAQATAARDKAFAAITGATAQPKQRIEPPQEMKTVPPAQSAVATPSPAKPEPVAELTVKPVPVEPDARTAVLARLRQKAVPPELVAAATPLPARPKPAAEPTARPVPAEPDARAAALARLRRQAPARGGAAYVAPDETPAAQPRQRLLDARSALEAGRVGEAEKLLQQAQIQLVLRPTTPSQNALGTASVAAGQTAEALSMLSVGDVQHAIQYINLAAAQADQVRSPTAAATAQPPLLPQ